MELDEAKEEIASLELLINKLFVENQELKKKVKELEMSNMQLSTNRPMSH